VVVPPSLRVISPSVLSFICPKSSFFSLGI
jgi:hypothetical protein